MHNDPLEELNEVASLALILLQMKDEAEEQDPLPPPKTPESEIVGKGATWLELDMDPEVKNEGESSSSSEEETPKKPVKAKQSRKRIHLDVNAKPPNPTKQRAGFLGAETKAAKRTSSQTEQGDSAEPAAKRGRREQIEIQTLPVIMDITEYVDSEGNNFTLSYQPSTVIDKDSLWSKLAKAAAELRKQADYSILDLSLTESDMRMIDLQKSAPIFPALLQGDGKLRLRRQQDKHTHVTAKAINPLLRKIERAAHDILLVTSELEKAPTATTQTRLMTRLLELPKSERTIPLQEHNDLINGYEYYLSAIAEKLRADLAFIHVALEKFVERATEQEHRLAALHIGLLNFLGGGALPQLVLDYASPGHHKCQCKRCAPDLNGSLREQIRREVQQEAIEEITKQVQQELTQANEFEQQQLRSQHESIDQEWQRYYQNLSVQLSSLHAFEPGSLDGYHACQVNGLDVIDPPPFFRNKAYVEELCSLLQAITPFQLSNSEKTGATHQLGERASSDQNVCEDTKVYMRQVEELGATHCWERHKGEICDEERSYLDSLRKQAIDALAGNSIQPKHQSGLRYDMEREATAVTQEWQSLLPQRKLGWPGVKTDEERRRARTYQSRKLWEDQITEMETENRETIKQLLADEDLRRMRCRPEPSAPEDAGLPLCEIPRCLIEVTSDQMDSLGHEPPYPPALDKHTHLLRQQTKDWRERYLSSRRDMEENPVAWITKKRGPMQNFKNWSRKYGYDEWANKVRTSNLGATEAYVLWEQTVKAAELNDTLEQLTVFYWIRKWKSAAKKL